MNVLEKILEEIEHEIMNNKEIGAKQCEGMARVMNIIRSHMNDCKTFEFDFAGVKSFDCPCGWRYVNTSSNGWIPCSERLPEETGYYLVQLSRKLPNEDYSDRVVALYDGEEKEFMCYGNLIIAWKLLPEQYKPKETQAAGMEHIMSRFTKAE